MLPQIVEHAAPLHLEFCGHPLLRTTIAAQLRTTLPDALVVASEAVSRHEGALLQLPPGFDSALRDQLLVALAPLVLTEQECPDLQTPRLSVQLPPELARCRAVHVTGPTPRAVQPVVERLIALGLLVTSNKKAGAIAQAVAPTAELAGWLALAAGLDPDTATSRSVVQQWTVHVTATAQVPARSQARQATTAVTVRSDGSDPQLEQQAAERLHDAGFGPILVVHVARGPWQLAIHGHCLAAERQRLVQVLTRLSPAQPKPWALTQLAVAEPRPPRTNSAKWQAVPVIVDLPSAHPPATAELLSMLRALAAGLDFSLHVPDRSQRQPVNAMLRQVLGPDASLGGRRATQLGIAYGGAPQALIAVLTQVLAPFFAGPVPTEKLWGDEDNDVWICLPDPTARQDADSQSGREDQGDGVNPFAAFGLAAVSNQQTWLGHAATGVQVGDLFLPRWQPPPDCVRYLPMLTAATPSLQRCHQFVLDANTRRTLLALTDGVLAQRPVLLEGPTAATKTSAALFLAAATGRPVLRVNLSDHSEVADLVGRYVPDGHGHFCWQDGPLVVAMRTGAWLVLDELNLADARTVERLNGVLEPERTLVLVEHQAELVVAEPGFALIATQNDSEYQGRAPLSPALRDRFQLIAVGLPDEADYWATLMQLVLGWRPEIEGYANDSNLVSSPDETPQWAAELAPTLVRLARLWTLLCQGGHGLGAERREGYIWTRRGLLALVADVRRHAARGQTTAVALQRALSAQVVDRVHGGADRMALARLMDGMQLGPNQFLLDAIGHPLAQPVPEPEATVQVSAAPLDDATLDKVLRGVLLQQGLSSAVAVAPRGTLSRMLRARFRT